jgi:hypothetical protein
MLSPEQNKAAALGGGYRLVALHRADEAVPLRLSLVVQDSAEPVGGQFVLLRDFADASVYLGCIADAAGTVREWIEIWVQNIENFATSFPSRTESASNRLLDELWVRRATAFREIEPDTFLSTGWETEHPPPIFFDLNLNAAISPHDKATGKAWRLCVDDALLKAKGLPEYSHSLVRYLTLTEPPPDALLLPVTPGAPENESTERLNRAVGNLIGFNPAGGLMMARTFAPLGFEEWSDLLSGKPWKGIEHGKKTFKPHGIYRTLQDANVIAQGGGHLFIGTQGRVGRLVESFHLKLHLLAAAIRLVRAHVRADQVPFLNITADSFRVALGETDSALPFLWNSRVTLAIPGETVTLPIETTSLRAFMPARFGETSVYRPPALHAPVNARGSVRIRKTSAGEEDGTSIEGTLLTQEAIATSGNDLLWIRLTLPSGRVDLYANVARAAEGGAAGETRFRTVPQQLSEAAVVALREAQGVTFPNVPFETLPLLSTPCDLYALAVLAVRALLVDDELSLPVALDELLNLGRQAGAAHDSGVSLSERLAEIARGDAQRAAVLGPHRLIRDQVSAEEARRVFPPDLWWATLAWIIQLVPALGSDSFCRDYGDAPPLALESVFDKPLAALEKLILQSRSLIVIDWNANREIASVIRKILSRHSGTVSR